MGALKVGDVIFGDDGNCCNVIAKSEIFTDHDCYELTFADGEKIIADGGHLWKTMTRADRYACLTNTNEYRAYRRATRPRRGKGLSPWTVKMNQERIYNVKEIPKPGLRTTKEIFDTVKVLSRKEQPYNHSVAPAKYLVLDNKDLLIEILMF